MRRSGSVGLIVPQSLETVFANPFVAELIQGIGGVFAEHNLTLLLGPPLNGSLGNAIAGAAGDGVISPCPQSRDPTRGALRAPGPPLLPLLPCPPPGGPARQRPVLFWPPPA